MSPTTAKRLGQHFLRDPRFAARMVELSGVRPGERVVEIGPGRGILTRALLEAGAQVVAVELDRRLAALLEDRFRGRDGLVVVQGDFLAFPIPRGCRVVGNIPYHLTTPILFKLLEEPGWASACLMVQREVGERMTAAPGSPGYGALSVAVQFRHRVEIVSWLKPGAFLPRPKVDSVVVRLDSLPGRGMSTRNRERFFRVVRAAFSQRRKMLANALSSGLGVEKSTAIAGLRAAGVDPARRGETLSLEEFARVAAVLNSPSTRR